MLRLFFVCLISLPFIIYYMLKVVYIEKHDKSYDEARRYKIARHMIAIMKNNGGIKTKAFGTENLPEHGGYVMFANHQGKYDTLGIISVHKKPCTILIDEKRSHLLFANEFITLLKGCRMDKTNIRSQIKAIYQIIQEVSNGRRYIVFPEGGYKENHNTLQDFLPGAFKCAIKSKSPIVPVALINSYKVFDLTSWSLLPVTTQVHFLKPLYYDDYKELSSQEISSIVKEKINETILQYAS
ncbi:MAG: 1-acyl-sn-glycerol-3-phosphate acyltransferase [Butyrivibrio sp.]|nr:1-acyl-sn-glycerol-3-phosphate acyltransferase [Butyrivibrio sp.]